MDTVTRRKFLIASGVTAGAALAAGAGAFTLKEILDTAGWQDKAPDSRTLVLLTLYGGNDGLNTVIPYADPAYQAARPALAYQPGEVLHLDAQLGLNPGLKGFAGLFGRKGLAIVRGVEYPKPDHSHFRSMDIWQTGSPAAPANTGWLGRWLDATGGDARHAVSFEPVLPVVLAGATTAGAVVPTGGRKTVVPAGLAKPQSGEPPLQARAARAYADLIECDAMIHNLPSPSASPDGSDGAQATATGGPSAALAAQLDLVARCVEAGVATRAFSVSLGGFDLHAEEKDAQQRLLGQLDTAVTAFVNRMAKTENGRKVVVAVYSEFGRRVRANASDGTDHGTASDVFLLGTPVKGGLYGTQPSLTDLDNGDLKVSTDFRDVYAMLLADVLGTEPGKVLPGWKSQLSGVLV
jgi:uncharacterized protein (DUF1501 family)